MTRYMVKATKATKGFRDRGRQREYERNREIGRLREDICKELTLNLVLPCPLVRPDQERVLDHLWHPNKRQIHHTVTYFSLQNKTFSLTKNA